MASIGIIQSSPAVPHSFSHSPTFSCRYLQLPTVPCRVSSSMVGPCSLTSSPTVTHRPLPLSTVTVTHRHQPSPAVTRRHLPSPPFTGSHPPSPAVPGGPLPSPIVPCRPLLTPGVPYQKMFQIVVLSSFLMTAVLEVQGRGRTAFCRPVPSFSKVARQVEIKDEDGLRFAVPSRPGLLAVPPPGPTGAPDRCEHWAWHHWNLLLTVDKRAW